MDPAHITDLLHPFTGEPDVSSAMVDQLQIYLDLLLKWNARVNLSAIRDPEQIVTRHFGESLFAAKALFPDAYGAEATTLADVGSGAGFPGIPIKLWMPQVELTLIESQNKKATFLREVLRTLKLERAQVFSGRAEQWEHTADIITLRAVEEFERVLPVAAKLLRQGGRICLLIGSNQLTSAQKVLGESWRWDQPHPVPLSTERIVAVAYRL